MSLENIKTQKENPETPSPLWKPDKERAEQALITRFMRECDETIKDYNGLWQWSIDNPEIFWSSLWDFCDVIGIKGDQVLKDGDKMPGARFFPQARINYAENLLRRKDDAPAIIFRGENGATKKLSFKELYDQVRLWQAALKESGVGKGDRVAGYLPNIPQAAIAALACASLGAIWSSASPDFGVQGVLDRFGQIDPKVLIAVDGYHYNGKRLDCRPNLKEVTSALEGLEKTVIIPFLDSAPDLKGIKHAMTGQDFIDSGQREDSEDNQISFERVEFNHPLFIMFSSGTTGQPKCIVHGHGGTLLQHLKEHQLHCDIHPDDRVFYFTTTGWMMWNWLLSALASRATIMLYDGSPFAPGPEVLWQYAQEERFSLFGTGAKYIDALRNQSYSPGAHFDLSSLKALCSTGSPLVHESFDYVYTHIKKDLHLASISGGTDIISCFVLGNPISPVYRGEIQGPGLAMAVDVYNDKGNPVAPGQGSGELVCTKPFPSMPTGFWNDTDGARYHSAYFEEFDNIWAHGDWIEKTHHGGFIIHGRSDATLNPGGVRIGTAEIYRQVEKIPEIAEALAVGQKWNHDERVVLFVVLNKGATLDNALRDKIRKQIRTGASPRHMPAKILEVPDIPRTKSGKLVELAVRQVIHNQEVKNIEALANPRALDYFRELNELDED